MFYLLYPIIFAKNIKNIPIHYIFPQNKLEIGDLLLPCISLVLFWGGSALHNIIMGSKLKNYGENSYAIIFWLFMGTFNFFMRLARFEFEFSKTLNKQKHC